MNDNLSISYENEKSQPQTTRNTTQYEMESTGIQAAYTMGGMTLAASMYESENLEGVAATKYEETELSVSFAF